MVGLLERSAFRISKKSMSRPPMGNGSVDNLRVKAVNEDYKLMRTGQVLSTQKGYRKAEATRNKCIASSNKCLTSSNKKLVGASALLVVTMFAIRNNGESVGAEWSRYCLCQNTATSAQPIPKLVREPGKAHKSIPS